MSPSSQTDRPLVLIIEETSSKSFRLKMQRHVTESVATLGMSPNDNEQPTTNGGQARPLTVTR